MALGACTPAEERCREIRTDRLIADLDVSGERRFWDELTQRLPSGGSHDSLRRVMRIEDAIVLRDIALADANSDADSQRIAGYYLLDGSDPKLTAPPRPSDERWYAEHCYQGRAR